MNNLLKSSSTDLWDRDTVYRLVSRWTRNEGAGFLALAPSQVASFARAANEINEPKDILPGPAGVKRGLSYWLDDAARRGDERGPWRRIGDEKPLETEIPALYLKVLEETLGNANLAENKSFYGIWQGQEADDVAAIRKLAVLRETTVALVKCYRARRLKKDGRDGS